MTRIMLLLITGFFGAIGPIRAGTVTQKKEDASLEIRWDADEPKLELADLISVTLTIEGDASLRVVAPLELAGDAKWQLVTRSGESRDKIGPERVRWRLAYRFAPREPGRIAFAFPDVKCRAKAGGEKVVAWDQVWFDVKAPVQTELRGISDVEPPAPIVPPDRAWLIWSAVAGSCVLLTALAIGLRGLLRRGTPRTAEQIALGRLRRLLAKRPSEHGRSERLVTLLTLIVRRYLDRALALPARRRTTPEFVQILEACATLTAEEKQFLTTFFVRCDAGKFAPCEMSTDEWDRWAATARQFLEQRASAKQSA